MAVLIAVIVIALRAQRRRKLAQTLEKRRDDEVDSSVRWKCSQIGTHWYSGLQLANAR